MKALTRGDDGGDAAGLQPGSGQAPSGRASGAACRAIRMRSVEVAVRSGRRRRRASRRCGRPWLGRAVPANGATASPPARGDVFSRMVVL